MLTNVEAIPVISVKISRYDTYLPQNIKHLNALQHAMALTIRMVTPDNQSPSLLPPYAETSSFQDPELEQTYHKFLSNSKLGAAGKDAERPSKRARLSIVNEQDTNRDVRSSILASIHNLLGFEQGNRKGSLGQIPV